VNPKLTYDHLPEAMIRATEHWEARRRARGEAGHTRAFTIAVSRETGARGTSVARELGRRLGWAVYDQELLKMIAQEMGLRENLVQSVDEKHVSWLRETLAAMSLDPIVSESAYVRHMVETVASLGAHGNCVIVGRAGSFLLPPETTLRVRLIAPVAERVEYMIQEFKLTRAEAEKRVRTTDRDRENFVREYFRKDATAPLNYDLVLNVARYSTAACAELIAAALPLATAEAHKHLLVAGA
jgi:cytidylate kinase